MRRRRSFSAPALNITPLVDVMLVLTVVLLVAAPLASKRLPLSTPVVHAATGGAANLWQLGFDGKSWYLDGRPVPFAKVQAVVPPGAAVELAADESLAYRDVARAIDKLQDLKPGSFSLTTR